jgi:diguanylate cyclase (GGDEF)-like protein/PAS domain S-box-containing protein
MPINPDNVGHGRIADPIVSAGPGQAPLSAVASGAAPLDLPDGWFWALGVATGDVFYVLRTEPDLAFEFVSDSITALVGYTPAEHYADPSLLRRMIDARDIAALESNLAAPLGVVIDVDLRWVHRDGHTVWTNHRARKRARQDGSVVIEGSGRDITALRETQERLVASEQEFRTLAENVSDVIVRIGADRRIEYASPSVTTMFGWDPAELVGIPIPDFAHPDDRDVMTAAHEEALAGGLLRFRGRMRCKNGSYRWVENIGRTVNTPDGSPEYAITVARDIEDQVHAEQALAASEERFRLAMVESPQGMTILDLERRFVEVNPALCRILDRDRHWLLSHSIADVVHPQDAAADLAARRSLLGGEHEYVTAERRFIRGDGDVVWIQHSIGLLRDHSGDPVSYVSHMQDITTTRHAAAQMAYQAAHDRMTGLLNRGELTDRLEGALTQKARTGTRIAVLYCDVDNLKTVNDGLGHAAGDALLLATGNRIASSVRDSDTVARVGGDEFVVILDRIRDLTGAEHIATHIHEAVNAPLQFEGTTLNPKLSIGVTIAETDQHVDDVLRDADDALYAAKTAGGDRVVVFHPNPAKPN